MAHLDGSQPQTLPAASNIVASEITSTQQDDLWTKQDQLILGWILSSLTEPVLNQVVACNSTREVWHTLQQVDSAQSTAQELEIRHQLHSGSLTMIDYLNRIQSLSDRLRSIGSSMSDYDLLMFILNGLSREYDPVVVPLMHRKLQAEPVTVADLTSMLLSFERRLLQHDLVLLSTPTKESTNVAANTAYPNKFTGVLGPVLVPFFLALIQLLFLCKRLCAMLQCLPCQTLLSPSLERKMLVKREWAQYLLMQDRRPIAFISKP
jgi:gag-polypeptide of LTR copia-type